MSDIETGTEWSHLLGRGMKGPLVDKELKPIVCDMVTWSTWKKSHPETTVLDMPHTSKNYTKDFYSDPGRFVLGFEVQGNAYSLSMKDLLRKSVHVFDVKGHSLLATMDKEGMVARLFNPKVGENSLEFDLIDDETMQDSLTKSRWSITGEAVSGPLKGTQLEQRVGTMSFRQAWQNFHPESHDVKL